MSVLGLYQIYLLQAPSKVISFPRLTLYLPLTKVILLSRLAHQVSLALYQKLFLSPY